MAEEDEGYRIRANVFIPRREVWFEFSHASGPGGQNVNKVSTAAALCFHPESSGALTREQKAAIAAKLATRINSDGVLRITASDGRSQSGNRVLAGMRFCQLLADALTPRVKRKPTRPTRASRERKLADKHLLAAKKAQRRTKRDSETE